MYMNNYLQHHGILGQKWGIRRYQNPDGTLTLAGKARYAYLVRDAKYTTRNRKKSVREAQKVSGVKTGFLNDKIKAGSKFQRLADSGETVGSRRKYVSILGMDNKSYLYDVNHIGLKDPETALRYELTAKRDLKVANGNQVANYIIKKYGDKQIDKSYKDTKNLRKAFYINRQDLDKADRKVIDAMRKQYYQASTDVNHFFNNSLYKDAKLSDKIFNHFIKKGYDAIVDVEDAIDATEYPLILLNPESSVELSRQTSIDEAWQDILRSKNSK